MVETTDEEIDAALARAMLEPELPYIVEAKYQRDLELFLLKLSDGRRLSLPRENLQPVAHATPEQTADFNITAPGGPPGTRLWWPQIDDGVTVEGLMEGRTGNDKWMALIQRRDVAA